MDVKSLIHSMNPIVRDTKAGESQKIQAEMNPERDANGKFEQEGRQKEEREPLTEEELKEAVNHLKELPGIKQSCLSISLIEQNGHPFVVVKDTSGKVVRRIPESDLRSLVSTTQQKTGCLLNKVS